MNPAPGATLDTDAIFDRIFAAGREDLADLRAHPIEIVGLEQPHHVEDSHTFRRRRGIEPAQPREPFVATDARGGHIPNERKGVAKGKSVIVRGGLGGRSMIKQKNKRTALYKKI